MANKFDVDKEMIRKLEDARIDAAEVARVVPLDAAPFGLLVLAVVHRR